MKLPLILTFTAAALATVASVAPAAAAVTGNPALRVTAPVQIAPESLALSAEQGAEDAHWLRLVSSDDDDDDHDEEDDDHEDDDDCEDHDARKCGGAKSSGAKGKLTPPDNGLFSTGKTPQVKSN